MKRLNWIAAALAAPLMLAGTARADYTYSTTITLQPSNGTSQTFGSGGSTLQVQGITSSPTYTGSPNGIPIAIYTDQPVTTTSPTDTGTIGFTDVVMITPTTGGSGSITVTGNVQFLRSDTGGQYDVVNFLSYGTPVTIGGVTYSLFGGTYAQPQVNAPLSSTNAGSISVAITATAVPEPSSVAALCVGGLLVVAPRLRRFVRRMAQA